MNHAPSWPVSLQDSNLIISPLEFTTQLVVFPTYLLIWVQNTRDLSTQGGRYSQFCETGCTGIHEGLSVVGSVRHFLIFHSTHLNLNRGEKESQKSSASAAFYYDTKLLSLTAATSPQPLRKAGPLPTALTNSVNLLPAAPGTQGILKMKTKPHSFHPGITVRTGFKL